MTLRWLALGLLVALGCESAPAAAPDERPAVVVTTAAEPEATPALAEGAPSPGPAEADAYQAPDAEGWGQAGALRFLEVVHGGAAAEARLPMVVMIHGPGDRPHRHWLQELPVAARVILPQAPEPYHGGFAWFPFRVGDNDSQALATGIARAAELLAQAIAILQRERPTAGKPIVGGFSQGGMLSYALALRHGAGLSLAHPIAGMLPRPLWPDARGPAPPIRALHGTSDRIVPHPPAEALVQHLGELGYDARLELFEGVGHSIPPAVGARMTETLVSAVREAAAAP